MQSDSLRLRHAATACRPASLLLCRKHQKLLPAATLTLCNYGRYVHVHHPNFVLYVLLLLVGFAKNQFERSMTFCCFPLARVRRLGDVVCTSWDTCSGLLASSARRGRIPELESCTACLHCLEQQQAQAHFCVPVPGPCSPKCMGCVVKSR